MIRPELRAALWRFREALTGAAVALLGSYWAIASFGLLRWIGFVLIAAGLLFAATGLQRGRLRSGVQEGPGVVEVTEGQILYMGPVEGGGVALDLLAEIWILGRGPERRWRLVQPGRAPVEIPLGAMGADQLFDLFATLPGLSLAALLRARDGAETHPVWRRDRDAPALPRGA